MDSWGSGVGVQAGGGGGGAGVILTLRKSRWSEEVVSM